MFIEIHSVRSLLDGSNRWYILYRTKSGMWDEITMKAATDDEAVEKLSALLGISTISWEK